MSALTEHLNTARAWWDGRTAREHVMMAGLAVVLALVLGWFLIVAPLLAWKAGTAARLDAAVQTHALASAAAGLEAPRGAARTPGEIEVLVADSATEAGVQIQAAVEGGAVTFTVESAETARLFGWIAALERAGVRVSSLSVLENADATLQAQGTVGRGTIAP